MKNIQIIDISDKANYDKKGWLCEENLIFFSDEWNLRNSQCINYINSCNGNYDRKIHGRKCVVLQINDSAVAKLFIDDYHIQGSNNLSVVYFGLYYESELVAVMSLGRHSRQIAENRIVLDRFCVKSGVHVQGGASKLFAHCIMWAKEMNYDEIISFSDNRWTRGHIYEVLGFSLDKEHKSDYCYVDTNYPHHRLSKQSQKKGATKCPEGFTELQWCEFRGLSRLWDCGKKRWVYYLKSGISHKEILSSRCAEQHKNGCFKHSHIRGYFKSVKCGCDIYYGSSYELRCMYLLEKDDLVSSFSRANTFVDREKRHRNPDLLVNYVDGRIEIIEVKAEKVLAKQFEVKKQVEETRQYCYSNNIDFRVWSESDSGLKDEKSIINWAKLYIAESTGNTEWIDRRREMDKKKAKKHYDNKIATNKVTIYCEYCKEDHTPLKLTYDKNIARNQRYICEREGGHIAGSKPKNKLVNPYVVDGKKKCNGCAQVKLFEEFGDDKAKSDGKSTRCKVCRSASAQKKYYDKG